MGVARAGFMLIGGVTSAIVCMLPLVPEASLEPMFLLRFTIWEA